MDHKRFLYLIILFLTTILLAIAIQASAFAISSTSVATPSPSRQVATEDELAQAQAQWARSSHADTYDNGMGADTTCAKCKSPFNWDSSKGIAATESLDCYACKRVPGSERPNLKSGESVSQTEWRDISCEVCHKPVGNSFETGVSFWNQALGQYEPVENNTELCAKCHEGQHGFEVVEEQEASSVHLGMECTTCHGNHGSPSSCIDCHNPDVGSGAIEHARHKRVNCTACHDAGGLSVWYEIDPNSAHYGEFITRRFAHALTSWPSHNLQSQTRCERCHHPQGEFKAILASEVACSACHPDGAALFWCTHFPRNPNPETSQDNNP